MLSQTPAQIHSNHIANGVEQNRLGYKWIPGLRRVDDEELMQGLNLQIEPELYNLSFYMGDYRVNITYSEPNTWGPGQTAVSVFDQFDRSILIGSEQGPNRYVAYAKSMHQAGRIIHKLYESTYQMSMYAAGVVRGKEPKYWIRRGMIPSEAIHQPDPHQYIQQQRYFFNQIIPGEIDLSSPGEWMFTRQSKYPEQSQQEAIAA